MIRIFASRFKKIQYSEELVQRVNELFHDLEHDNYHEDHPEIIKQETKRWKAVSKEIFGSIPSPRTIIDIGTGTGFVPLVMGSFTEEKDTFVCSDISQKMLDEAKKNITNKKFNCKFDYKKINVEIPLSLPFKNNSAEVITINSVLHHIHDTKTFLKEVERILKPGGVFIVGHEPNTLFNKNYLLQIDYTILSLLYNFKQTSFNISKKLGLSKWVENAYLKLSPGFAKTRDEQQQRTDKINEALLREKIIKTPLKRSQILEITDIKVFEGFDPTKLLPDFVTIQIDTYNHLHWVLIKNPDNPYITWYDKVLKRLYPNSGATFTAVYQKPE